MSKFLSAAAVVVMGLFMAGLFAAPVSAITATATAPVWQVGDSWAMGKEVNLGANITEKMTELDMALKMFTNLTIDELKIDSKASYYVLFKVTGQTATDYTITAKMAVKFATQAKLAVSGQLPVADTYDVDEMPMSKISTVPKEMKTMSVEMSEKLGMVLSATATVKKSDMAINDIAWALRTALVLDLDAKNIPQINETGTSQTISYKNYDIGMEMVANANATMVFSPALDIYQFPFSVGDIWWTNNSMVTVNGDVSGFFNAHGLTAEQEEMIFTDEVMEATGSTSFPIQFDKLTSPDGEITDGRFGPIYGNTSSVQMECLSSITKSLNGVSRSVFVIEIDEGPRMLYSPGLKFIAGMSTNVDPESLPEGLPEEVSFLAGIMGAQEMGMDTVTVETATTNIASIETYTESVATQAGGKGNSGGSLADFFLKAPFTGIIMVALSAVVIGALLFIGLRARKN